MRRLLLILLAAVVCVLLQLFVGRVYLIPSASMEPTLHVGDRIVAREFARDAGPGAVVVFRTPPTWQAEHTTTRSANVVIRGLQNIGALLGVVPPDEDDLVKRVVATGGQTVKCCDAQGRIEVDGKPLTEPYLRLDAEFRPGVLDCTTPRRSKRCFPPVTVPSGRLWVMGDNRDNSKDSRAHIADEYQGTVAVADVRATAVATIWPLGRLGAIPSAVTR